ncbi:SDR family oxidoreductase [Curtobacterium pusillum]|uniref:SDR family oxidoreductase n=1 Tax=Curtobacterium pusillum TaxID=69373 RepID=UPI00382ECEE4
MTARRYAVVGGSSGIGFALAEMLVARGDRVLLGGRSADRLANAATRLTAVSGSGDLVETRTIDTGDPDSIAAFFADAGPLHGLFTPAASYSTSSFRDSTPETTEALFASKFWGQYRVVRAALDLLTPDAGVVLMSGAASVVPLGAAAYTACNAALEGLARGLAVELAPIRVNCLSPGTTDSDLWRGRPAEQREPAYAQWSELSAVGRPGTSEEQAHSALFLLDNGNVTGTTLYCDGGVALR